MSEIASSTLLSEGPKMKVSLLTGGGDKPYALGLLSALHSKGVTVDFIGNDDMSTSELLADEKVNFFNLRGDQNPRASTLRKIVRVAQYYVQILAYAMGTDSSIFHILWFNKFIVFDRTLLNLFYKLLGKRLVFTAHNVDDKQRDGNNNAINRISLKLLYHIVDHIFVHTPKMRTQLLHEFSLKESKVTVIPFGINNTLPATGLTKQEARVKLGLKEYEKVLLFFGHIAPYKGLEYLLKAMHRLKSGNEVFKLIIAGQVRDCHPYWERLETLVGKLGLRDWVMKRVEYIPDREVEVFFKSSDVLVLPYKFIFQSGVLFLSYSFGLPVIATDVGSLRDDILDGETGMLCRPEDSEDLADTISRYFASDLYRCSGEKARAIIAYANEKYSWDHVAKATLGVYQGLANADPGHNSEM